MNSIAQVCASYLQAQGLEGSMAGHAPARPALALARQWGTPSAEVERLLLARLDSSAKDPAGKWTLFDDNLVGHVLREHHLPEVLARAMPEDRAPRVDEFWREILNAEPSQWDLVQKTNDTLYRLAKRGGCILVGRGAAYLTRDLSRVVRAAIMGSPRGRANRIAAEQSMDFHQALKEVERHDEASRRYLSIHFGRQAEGWEGFDLVLNSDHLSPDTMADLLHRVLKDRMG